MCRTLSDSGLCISPSGETSSVLPAFDSIAILRVKISHKYVKFVGSKGELCLGVGYYLYLYHPVSLFFTQLNSLFSLTF